MKYRARLSTRDDRGAEKPWARHDVTTSSRPSAYVGKEGRQPKSRRKRAFDVEKEELKRRVPYRPRNTRASHRGMRRGGRASTRRAISPRNPASGTGRSSTRCHTPVFGASAAVTNALAASSVWIIDHTGLWRPISTGRPFAMDSARILVCQPSAE